MNEDLPTGQDGAGSDSATPSTESTAAEPTSAADAALSALGMKDGEAGGVIETPTGEVVEAAGKDAPADKPANPADAKVDPVTGKTPEVKPPAKPGEITEEDLQRPEHLSHKARDRFEKLVTGYKAEKTRADEAHAELSQARESFKALQDLGFRDEASGRDLIEFAKFRQALSSNPQQALQILQQSMRQIELQHGLRAPSTSALEAYPDLVQAVNGEKLDYQHALEVARAREAQAAQQRQNQQYESRQRETFQTQQAMESAIGRVEQMEAQWRQTNPDYAALHQHIQAAMPDIARNFPPAMWPQQVELLYGSLQRAMTAQARSPSNMPTPLRGNGHAASRPAPKTAAEAALQALGMES